MNVNIFEQLQCNTLSSVVTKAVIFAKRNHQNKTKQMILQFFINLLEREFTLILDEMLEMDNDEEDAHELVLQIFDSVSQNLEFFYTSRSHLQHSITEPNTR